MVDVLTAEQRRLNMSRIRGKNTKPELLIRSALHRRGLRFRLHRRDLPGTPDIVLPKRRAVIFVHGCFWHGHGCHLSKIPQTRTAFWTKKIEQNRLRDRVAEQRLKDDGWRVVVIWECLLRGPKKLTVDTLIDKVVAALDSNRVKIYDPGSATKFQNTSALLATAPPAFGVS